ncbi:MAG: 3-keto-5-aminohexanoate cleavage protein [Syntrophaceae bacterium]|nr:3-keto-5-aminohexanoate cleavage protein [Syntrophaceae bacterium]
MDHIWDHRDIYEYDRKLKDGMPPLIISVAITGGAAGKEVNPNLPETPEEQAKSVLEAYQAGASAVHIHARDPLKGYAYSSVNPAHYLEINRRVRALCPDIIINNTTGAGAGNLTAEERMRSLDAGPEVASLNCGPIILKGTLPRRKAPLTGRDEPMNLDGFIIPVTVSEIELFAKTMTERNVKPEMEVYNPQQFNFVNILIEQKMIRPPYWFSLIFSNASGGIGVSSHPRNIVNMIDALPKESIFQCIGVGPTQLFVNTMSIISGGHVRVGMEDSVLYGRGKLLESNAQAVERIVRLAKELGREVATPAVARKMLGISETPSQY